MTCHRPQKQKKYETKTLSSVLLKPERATLLRGRVQDGCRNGGYSLFAIIYVTDATEETFSLSESHSSPDCALRATMGIAETVDFTELQEPSS